MELDYGARPADSRPGLLDIYGDQWRTPLRSFAPAQVGNARLRLASYPPSFYHFEGTGGFEFYRVRRAPLPVVILDRRDSTSPATVGDGWAEWMVDDPLHWYAMRERVDQLQPGRILVAGLGLGIMLRHLLARRNDVTAITVVELDPDVIALIQPTLPADPRVTVVQDDYYRFISNLPAGDRPNAVLWDLAVGSGPAVSNDLLRAEVYTGLWLPGVPLHRFGLRGPDRLGRST